MAHNLSRFPLSFDLCLVLLLSITLSNCSSSSSGAGLSQSSLYMRVTSSGIIRCSYLTYPPYCMKDPNTGKLSGFFVEAIEKAGSKLGLKIVWCEEVGYESLFEGLRTKRFDVFAGGLWPNAQRARVGDFSIPLFYSAVKAYGRKDESRFENNLSAINSPKIKIAVIDSAMEDLIAKTDFPLAQRLSLTQLSPFSQNLLNVITKKADVTFAESGIVSSFLKKNPGTLRELAPKQPLRIFGNVYVFSPGEPEFKNMLNTILEEMLNSGEIDELLKKYKVTPGSFYKVVAPYQTPNK